MQLKRSFKNIWIIGLLFMTNIAPAQVDSVKVNNEALFFQKLTDGSGLWVVENEMFNGQEGFSHFIMKFNVSEFGGIEGVISGLGAVKDTVNFWKITEFLNPASGETVFIQKGKYGYAISNANYDNENERTCTFNLTYNNGAIEMHKDIHVFIDKVTLETKSEVFNFDTKKWVVQPTLIWKKVE